MTLIFDAKLPITAAQTHALVVGVNEYPHLPNGTKYDDAPAFRAFGLDQLTSPVVSAGSIADWLVTKHRNQKIPLGSVSILLAPGIYKPSVEAAHRLNKPAGTSLEVDLATFDNIKMAFGRWYVRLNGSPGNIGMFYFSGHGLEAADRYLLPADYGADPMDPFDKLINLTVTHIRMDRNRARTQLYFLDACREQPKELKEAAAQGPVGSSLIGALGGSPTARDAPIFHAALRRGQAAGEPGKASYFAQALLECLDGTGARDVSGNDCPVNHPSLATALKAAVALVAEEKKLALSCPVDGKFELDVAVDFHFAKPPVQAMTLIECDPAEALESAVHLSITDRAGEIHKATLPRTEPWRHKIPAGRCTLNLQFAAGARWEDLTLDSVAYPPLFKPYSTISVRAVKVRSGSFLMSDETLESSDG